MRSWAARWFVCVATFAAIAMIGDGCGRGTGGRGGSAGTGGSAGMGGGGGGIACLEADPPQALEEACEACLDASSDPVTDGCCSLAATDPEGLTLCQAASACMRVGGSGACNVGGDVTGCYCGTHPASCDQPGGPDGPCVAEITAAAGRNVVSMSTDTPTEAQIIDRLGDTTYAVGRAATIQTIAGAFCPSACGL